MNEKLKKDILQALYERKFAFEFNLLKKELMEHFGHERRVEGYLDVFSSEVLHLLDVLVGEGLVHKQVGGTAGMGISTFYSLTSNGYNAFKPWHKKVLDYFRRNIETTVVSVVVSTIVTALLTFLLNRMSV